MGEKQGNKQVDQCIQKPVSLGDKKLVGPQADIYIGNNIDQCDNGVEHVEGIREQTLKITEK